MTTDRIVVDEIEAGSKNDASKRTIAASGCSRWMARYERGALRGRPRGERCRSSRVPRLKRRSWTWCGLRISHSRKPQRP